ncbi:LysR family transcriptional regulator [Massilia sp. CMS3.1]|uniref:LysR family transcriptional regulator n=1 Tax=Massilia sp. CMS3.1 TaxID=3373083 RepID=UPI003EE5F70D
MNSNHEPSLDDLSVFLAVFDTAGFRAAAKRLGLSPSKVSDTITRLEAQLGVPLLTRNTRSVMPTEAGRALAARMSPLLAETRAALLEVTNSEHQIRGLLKLNVSGAVMVDILPPLIERFLKVHPEVRVEIVVEDRLIDAIADGCVAGIRYGEHLAQDMIAVPIGPQIQQLALCAAPSYIARCGHPLHPGELSDHECVRLRFSSGVLTAWTFERGTEVVTVNAPGRVTIGVHAAAAAINLTRAGCGLIYTFKNWLEPYMQSGELVPVLPDWWQTFGGPRLYFSSRSMPATLRAFVDLVAQTREAGEGMSKSPW